MSTAATTVVMPFEAWHSRGPTARRAMIVAAAVVAILITSAPVPRRSAADAVLRRLAVFGNYRGIEPRLSIAGSYAAFRPNSYAAQMRALAASDASLFSATVNVLKRGGSSAGLAHLLTGNWNAAIPLLQETNPLDAASAYYMRGLAAKSLDDFSHALQCLSDAPDSAQTHFNRALILEQLFDREAAAAEWRAYLAVDDRTSPWAVEARRHLAAATRPSITKRWAAAKPLLIDAAARGDLQSVDAWVNDFPKEARRAVEMDLLPQWADAMLRHDAVGAANALTAARNIALALAKRSPERLLVDVTSAIAGTSDPATLVRLARGFVACREGREAIDLVDSRTATERLTTARHLLASTPAAAALAAPYIGTARYYAYDYDGAERIHDEMLQSYAGRENSYVALFSYMAWLHGLVATVRGNGSDGLRSFEQALAGFTLLGEKEHQAAQHTNLADTLTYLGDTERAAAHRYQALAIAEELEDARRLHAILSEASDAALAEGLPAAALVFQERLVRAERQDGNALRLSDALIRLSTILRRNGQREQAVQRLAEAGAVAAKIADPAVRERVLADIASAEAWAYREVDDGRVIACLTRSIEFFHRVDLRMPLAQLLLERGRARLRLEDVAGAERDFHDGIGELESQRRRVDDAGLRIAYFDRAETLFSDLALLLHRRGRSAEAFDAVERSRARELLDATTGARMDPLPLAEVMRGLPADTAIVTYSMVGNGLLASVLTRNGLRMGELPTSERAIALLVEEIGRGYGSLEGLPDPPLRRLWDELIAPLPIADGMRLVIIPDKAVYGVPFAALRRPDGRYLIEGHVLSIVPSATLFVRNAARDCDRAAAASSSALLVASPQRPHGFESLAPLRYAGEEVAGIARFYAQRRIVDGFEGETLPLLAMVGEHDCVHFASHAVVNEQTPSASMLLIGEEGRLRAADIEKARFERTRLVVLSACSTAAGRTHRGEGVLSLARAFMAASVPSVVATVAPVEDETAGKILTAFHRAYSQSCDPAAAMQTAQIEMLRSGNATLSAPSSWSAFEVIGGSCERKETKPWPSRSN